MLKEVPDPDDTNPSDGGSLLDEIVRDGARQMLAAALRAEVAGSSQRTLASSMRRVAGSSFATATRPNGR